MITRRTHRRRQSLDAYVRIELEERGVLQHDPPSQQQLPQQNAVEQTPVEEEDVRQDRPA